ncbi:hypothetical protein Hanom_Chr01g00002131 [Helianthus anomalus]
MDGVNEPEENGKISNLLDPNAEKQTFGRKSQNWPNLKDENGILLSYWKINTKKKSFYLFDRCMQCITIGWSVLEVCSMTKLFPQASFLNSVTLPYT